MRGESSRDVLRHLRTLYRYGVVGALSDEQLLERFLGHRDETAEEAFAELVQRHGPMVLGVCRRILGDAHEAEDAFQATFLVLARKAGSVLRREKVANWLYGVAVRTAREARGRAMRRRTREERVSAPIHIEPPDEGFPDELRAILDEELARLPARYRGPVVLCELEGLSRLEAARRLDIPEGTLSSRLSRAKAQLRDRLARRGVTIPAVALSTALLREAQAVSLPISLIEATVEAATTVAAGASATAVFSASVASLSEGVLKTMLLAKLKGISLGIGVMTAVVSGAVVLAQSGPAPKGDFVPASPSPKMVEPRVVASPSEADRTAALEKKLDRILDALDRLSRPTPDSVTEPPSGPIFVGPGPAPARRPQTGFYVVRPGPPLEPPGPRGLPPMPTDAGQPPPMNPVESEPAAPPVLASVVEEPTGVQPIPPREVHYTVQAPKRSSIDDRLNSAESKLRELAKALKASNTYSRQLEIRLSELERRVGGSPTPAPTPKLPTPVRGN